MPFQSRMFFGHPYPAPVYAEHVLRAERGAGPVMGLDLRHGNQEICFQHRPAESEMLHALIARATRRANPLRFRFAMKSPLRVILLAELSQLGTSEPVKCYGISRG